MKEKGVLDYVIISALNQMSGRTSAQGTVTGPTEQRCYLAESSTREGLGQKKPWP